MKNWQVTDYNVVISYLLSSIYSIVLAITVAL